ncbi:response regulator transcription factor [Thorsellia anophelis]|uniref:Two component transcriptional regulator, winged helix family n=1 Tax=Thorsellia anophelis DSM 18579 TaxID=1123402 RepID=A0A1H9YQ46_9GAMM|nr:response regulator transcription factor [Thorsellia anophelis]SES71261.1 two component transcriptional regulator, winged helix family [Thorsellia anophelis DSM 18579]
MKLLVIEDDKKVSQFIERGFKELGHNVDIAEEGKTGLFLAMTEQYDALIVDRMLPGIEGLTIVQTLRAASNKIPIIVLSAMGKVDDRVKGLRSGADDYLVKPFAFEELLARVEVLIERCSGKGDVRQTELVAHDLVMDLLARKVTRNGVEIELQSREFRLLEYLLRNKGQMVTRTMLLEHVWDYHFDPQTNVIDVHISRLRNKIDKGFENKIIKTIRGSGYIIDDSIHSISDEQGFHDIND